MNQNAQILNQINNQSREFTLLQKPMKNGEKLWYETQNDNKNLAYVGYSKLQSSIENNNNSNNSAS